MKSGRAENLALYGGRPVRSRPLPPWPYFSDEEIDAAVAVLRSGKVNYWTGDQGRQFEREFATSVGRKYAVAVANGTLALELALYALGVGPGDEVIVPSRTFIASASCAAMRGAVPVCVDLDPVSQTVTADTIRAALSPRTKAIVVRSSGASSPDTVASQSMTMCARERANDSGMSSTSTVDSISFRCTTEPCRS